MDHSRFSIIQTPGCRILARITDFFIIISLICAGVGWWNKSTLPQTTELLQQLYQDPIQTKTAKPPFTLEYANKRITIEPLANYEIWILITSLSDTNPFVFGHERDDINVRDLCGIWNKNLSPQLLPYLHTVNAQWTCYASFDGQGFASFHGAYLSNNHLISSDEAVREDIRNLHLGDQVYLKGMLVRYTQPNWGSFWRGSSLVRTDAGNGACETLYIEKLNVLKRSNVLWHSLYNFGFWGTIFGSVLRIIITGLDIFVLSEKVIAYTKLYKQKPRPKPKLP